MELGPTPGPHLIIPEPIRINPATTTDPALPSYVEVRYPIRRRPTGEYIAVHPSLKLDDR